MLTSTTRGQTTAERSYVLQSTVTLQRRQNYRTAGKGTLKASNILEILSTVFYGWRTVWNNGTGHTQAQIFNFLLKYSTVCCTAGFWHFLSRVIVSEMTYNVSMGTLNPTIPFFLVLSLHVWYSTSVFCHPLRNSIINCSHKDHLTFVTISCLLLLTALPKDQRYLTRNTASFCTLLKTALFINSVLGALQAFVTIRYAQ